MLDSSGYSYEYASPNITIQYLLLIAHHKREMVDENDFFQIEIPPEASRGQTSSFVYGVPQGNAFTLPLPPALTTRTIANPMAAGLGANQNLLVELGKQLLEAARIGDENQIQDLLQRGAPMTADWLGTSPLHCAALNGHAHIAKILVNAGCSRDARTKVDKTALHLAATSGNSEITEMLLKAGADVNVVDAVRFFSKF